MNIKRIIFAIILLAIAPKAMANEVIDSCQCQAPLEPTNFNTVKAKLSDGQWVLRKGSTFAFRTVMKLGIDYTLKHEVNELRPDRSANNSFPSRHSSWAYGIGGSVAYYLAPYSPWWALGSHAIANAIGLQRVMARRHWAGDVMAGAGIGLSTDALSWAIANWIWGREDRYVCWYTHENSFRPSLDVTTGVAFPLAQKWNDTHLCTALQAAAKFTLPTSEHWGFAADLAMASMPVKIFGENNTVAARPINSLGLTLGMATHHCLGESAFAISARAQAGYKYNFGNMHSIEFGRHSFMANASVQGTMMLLRNFAVGAEAGYSLSTLTLNHTSAALSSINLAFFTRMTF